MPKNSEDLIALIHDNENTQDTYLSADELIIPSLNFRTLLISFKDSHSHSHDYTEVFYILQGEITHVCNGIKEKLCVGDMIFLQTNVAHHFERTRACTYRNLCFSPHTFDKACEFLGSNAVSLFKNANGYLKTNIERKNLDVFEEYIQKIIQCYSETDTAASHINTLAALVANTFLPRIADTHATKGNYPSWFRQVLTLFDKSEIIRYGIPAIKMHLHFSYEYICRAFKKYMNTTPLQYLNEIRLNYAATLLKSTNISILEISTSVWFSSVGYFNRIFKNHFHITPVQYRKQG